MQASFQTERRCPCVSNHEPRFEARVSRARFACRPHRSCCNNQELVIACDPGGALRNESSSLVPLANERALAASRFRRHQLRKPMQPLTFLPSIFLAEEDAEHAGNCCTKAKVWFLFLNFLNFPSEFFLPYNAISQLDLSQRENRTLLISVFFFFWTSRSFLSVSRTGLSAFQKQLGPFSWQNLGSVFRIMASKVSNLLPHRRNIQV